MQKNLRAGSPRARRAEVQPRRVGHVAEVGHARQEGDQHGDEAPVLTPRGGLRRRGQASSAPPPGVLLSASWCSLCCGCVQFFSVWGVFLALFQF